MLSESEKTWKDISDKIETELEAQFCSNNDSIEGITFTISIVKELPEDIEIEE